MKHYWQTIETRIDGLTLRERGIMFVVVALALVMGFTSLLLDTQYETQKRLSQQIEQEQAQVLTMQAQIQQKVLEGSVDPDAANRQHLQQLQQQIKQMRTSLLDTQKALVSPDKMPTLLENILKQNRGLRLTSLRTLPVLSLSEMTHAQKEGISAAHLPVASSPAAVSGVLHAADAVYSHSVEITVQGNYLDLMHYLADLEAMPWQIYWSNAKLQVDEYPSSTLTLTLFTMSLDKRWLNI